MTRSIRIMTMLVALALLAQQASAQESKSAKATREKLKQVIDEFDAKDIGTKSFFEDVNREIAKPIRFTIDNASGVSNNTKLTYKAKKVTVEKLLNDVSDANGFGWYVVSNEGNNKVDGTIVIRKTEKGKERGYEAGKEPKKTSSLPMPLDQQAAPRTTFAIWPGHLFQTQPTREVIFDRYIRTGPEPKLIVVKR